MSRRVRLGPDKNGNFALKVALAGQDAYEGNENDANVLSFSSNWSDMVNPHAVGILASGAQAAVNVNFPALSYVPFVEVHGFTGTTFYDDRTVGVLTMTTSYIQFIRRPEFGYGYVIFKHQ